MTDDKNMHNLIPDRDSFYSALIDNIPDMIVRFDTDLKHVYCNSAVERQLGIPAELFIGKSFLDFDQSGMPAEQIELMYQTLKECLISGQEQDIEQRLQTPAGYKYFLTRIVPETDVDGKIASIIAVTRDISDRKQAEEEIKQNEARMQSLIKVFQYNEDSIQSLLKFALDEAINITGSKAGYIYHYDEEKKEFILNNWSMGAMSECKVIEPQTIYQLQKTGVWGEAVRQRKAIILNDFQAPHPMKKGFPEGHIKLNKFLTIPVFNSNKNIVAVLGVANKETEYVQHDILQLTLFMDAVWVKVERKQAEEEIRQLYLQLEDEVSKAYRIHKRTLPAKIPEIKGISIATHYQPMARMGGDSYNVVKSGNKLVLYLSDVMGHGLDSAMLSVFAKEAIDSYISLKPEDIRPEKLLRHIGRQFQRESYPDEYLICFFMVVLDLDTMMMTYANAGFQNPPLATLGDGKNVKLNARGIFISNAMPYEMVNYEEHNIALTPGSTIFFSTDGLAEQLKGEEFFYERYEEIFYESSHLPPEDIVQIINKHFYQFNNNSLTGNDDITFLVMNVSNDKEKLGRF